MGITRMIRFPVKPRSNHMQKSASLLSRALSSESRSVPFQGRTKDGRGLSSYPAIAPEEENQNGEDARSPLSQSHASPLHSVAWSGKNDANSKPKKDKFNQTESKKSHGHLSYIAEMNFPITSHLHIVKPDEDTPRGIWPVFRLMVIYETC